LSGKPDTPQTDSTVFFRPVVALLVFGWLPATACADWLNVWQHSPLTTAQQLRDLTPEQARQGRPIKLTGVVTHPGSPETGFYFQDATAGILVRPTPQAKDLKLGDHVEVEGTTHEGAFAPCVSARSVKRVGTSPLPDSQPYNLSINDSRWLDGQWVHAWAIIQTARSEAGFTYIDIDSAHGRAVLKIPGEASTLPARRMRNEAIAIRGVCVASFQDRLICDVPTILLTELPKPGVGVAEAADGIDAPPRMIDHLLRFAPQPYPGTRRVKIAGVVTAVPLHNLLIVQDSSGGVAVWTDNPTGLPIGATVEAYGLLRVNGHRLSLSEARVKRGGDRELPPPVAATANELAKGLRDAVRVRLAGRAEELHALEGWTAIGLSENGVRFAAYVPGTPEQNGLKKKVEIGSRVSLVGVAADVSPDRKPTSKPGVFLNTEAAVDVLEPPIRPQLQSASDPAWLTTRRAAYMLGGLARVFLLGGGWLVSLRGQARRAAQQAKLQAEEKVRLERQLRQASKLEAVGRLTGGIAHDFNNLLTVINGCAELLAEEAGPEGGRLTDLTDDIRKAGERAAALTGQLLTYSRKRDIVIQPVQLNDVVRDTIRLLDRVIGEAIRVESKLSSDLPPIRGEAGLLHQVLMNLAVNARDAMPEGGVLTFATSLVTDPTSQLDGKLVGRHFVRLTVADTGVGMSEEVKARLFEPFFTTKAVGSGTGLGLATVLSITQMLHGRIHVDTKVGGGTRFHIDLRALGEPVSEPEFALPSTPTPLPSALTAPKLAGKTILVVEDNELVRATIAAGLKGEGAIVLSADRPDDALRLLATHTGPVDVLVTDVVMPGMSGPALVERTREARPEMRVVFMSGYAPDEVDRQGVRADEVEFLQKPFTPDNLIRRLLRVLALQESGDRSQESQESGERRRGTGKT